jgi:glycosyltransferase involved in cell wall biosynthesis
VGGVISVLLATMGRPDMAVSTVASLIDTTEGHEVEIVLAVDCDTETPKRVGWLSRPSYSKFPVLVVDQANHPRGSSRAWNDALALAKGDQIVLAADDLEFEPGWLDAALETLAQFEDGWGLVGFNDGHWGPELSTHYLMSRRFIVEVLGGVVAWDCYHHSFNDREANARAVAAGRYAWCENARVYHRHWLFGDRMQDGTDTRMLGGHQESERRFFERQAAGFPNDYEAVIT